jgi:hypothetical protein
MVRLSSRENLSPDRPPVKRQTGASARSGGIARRGRAPTSGWRDRDGRAARVASATPGATPAPGPMATVARTDPISPRVSADSVSQVHSKQRLTKESIARKKRTQRPARAAGPTPGKNEPRRSATAPNEPDNKPRPPPRPAPNEPDNRSSTHAEPRARRTQRSRRPHATGPIAPAERTREPGSAGPAERTREPGSAPSTPAPNEPGPSTPSRPPRTRSLGRHGPDDPHRTLFIPSPREHPNTTDPPPRPVRRREVL